MDDELLMYGGVYGDALVEVLVAPRVEDAVKLLEEKLGIVVTVVVISGVACEEA